LKELHALLTTGALVCLSVLHEAEMRAVILAFVVGVALAAWSAQAAAFPSKPRVIEFSPAPSVELVAQNCGHGWYRHHWRDHWVTGTGVTAFRTSAGAHGWNILIRIGAVPPGALVTPKERHAHDSNPMALIASGALYQDFRHQED
jgi:hypothetical protein